MKQDERYDHIPDYAIRLEDMTVVFVNRMSESLTEKDPGREGPSVPLGASTYAEARDLAPGWDIYYLEREWRAWMADGGLDAPRNPDKAFLGFVGNGQNARGVPDGMCSVDPAMTTPRHESLWSCGFVPARAAGAIAGTLCSP